VFILRSFRKTDGGLVAGKAGCVAGVVHQLVDQVHLVSVIALDKGEVWPWSKPRTNSPISANHAAIAMGQGNLTGRAIDSSMTLSP